MQVVRAAALDRWTELSDERVIELVRRGQTPMFEVLMRRHNERVYRAARAILRDDAEAEDVVQQAYVNAFANLGQFRGQAQFSTWLTRIAVHESISRARRAGRWSQFDDTRGDEPMTQGPDPERQAFGREIGALLESAIDSLPDGCREVVVLRQVEGMSTAEVATALDISEDAVKTRLSRGRAALRRHLMMRADISAPEAFRFLRPRCDRVVSAVLARIV